MYMTLPQQVPQKFRRKQIDVWVPSAVSMLTTALNQHHYMALIIGLYG
jgi:hypothetical protein